MPTTQATNQIFCEISTFFGDPPHSTVISQKSNPNMSDKVSQDMSPLASEAECESTPVTPKGHGGQPKAPLVSFHTEGPRSPPTSKKGISSPFSYASAVANRSKAPVTGSVECEQYRALAAKARESPRILSIKLQKPPASNQEPEKPLSQADWGELLFNSC